MKKNIVKSLKLSLDEKTNFIKNLNDEVKIQIAYIYFKFEHIDSNGITKYAIWEDNIKIYLYFVFFYYIVSLDEKSLFAFLATTFLIYDYKTIEFEKNFNEMYNYSISKKNLALDLKIFKENKPTKMFKNKVEVEFSLRAIALFFFRFGLYEYLERFRNV